jgi:hypothetical protein
MDELCGWSGCVNSEILEVYSISIADPEDVPCSPQCQSDEQIHSLSDIGEQADAQ